jgi:hypothetical protein
MNKTNKLMSSILILILSLAIFAFPTSSIAHNTIFEETAFASKYHQGVSKTVKISKNTTRLYVSKDKANNMLKTGGTVSVFIPAAKGVGTGIKWILALFGIFGNVKGGFYFDITKTANYYSSHTPWYHNFHWQ